VESQDSVTTRLRAAGAVVVVATDGFREAAVWGELLATRALARGATGAVSDGAVRDLAGLRGSSPSRRSRARLSRTVRPWAPSTSGTASCDALGEADG